jgi:hypothetical protein
MLRDDPERQAQYEISWTESQTSFAGLESFAFGAVLLSTTVTNPSAVKAIVASLPKTVSSIVISRVISDGTAEIVNCTAAAVARWRSDKRVLPSGRAIKSLARDHTVIDARTSFLSNVKRAIDEATAAKLISREDAGAIMLQVADLIERRSKARVVATAYENPDPRGVLD